MKARTKKEVEADRADLDVFRAVSVLDRFAYDFRDPKVREMALSIDGMRHRLRRHMHADDREETKGYGFSLSRQPSPTNQGR